MILILQLSVFLFYAVIYPFHLLMACISPSWFYMQEHVLHMRTFQKRRKVDVAGLYKSHLLANSTIAIMTLFVNPNYHLPICWMICVILFVRLSFSYRLWRRAIPYSLSNFDYGYTASVTSQQRMYTAPRDQILPSHLSEICVTVLSILYLLFGLWLCLSHC